MDVKILEISAICCSVIAVAFGIYPAQKGAAVDPITAVQA